MIVHGIKTTMLDRASRPKRCPTISVHPVNPPAEHASVLTKFKRLRHETMLWARSGLPLAPRAVRKEREAFCEACEYYQAAGNWGLGECQAPGCGCTRVKLRLATAKCPHPKGPKWGAWVKG